MLITIILVSVWALLMLYAASAEYNYYQSVKTLEPELWQQLGAPRFLKVPMVFVSKKGLTLLNSTENETVRANAKKTSPSWDFVSFLCGVGACFGNRIF